MIRTTSKLPTAIFLAVSLFTAAGCADVSDTTPTSDETPISTTSQAVSSDDESDGAVEVITTELGPNHYNIVAHATFGRSVAQTWPLFCDFERLLQAGPPGDITNFQWLDGGSAEQVPSEFQFLAGGQLVHEEVYFRDHGRHTLRTMRYRLLEPAIVFEMIDSTLQLENCRGKTCYTATRDATMMDGVPGEALAAAIQAETEALQAYFATKPKKK